MKRKQHRREKELFIMFLTGKKMEVFKREDLKPEPNSDCVRATPELVLT